MGQFAKEVRAENIVGPLRTEFKLAKWQRLFEQKGEDDEDRNVYEAGRLIFEKANHIRSSLKVTFSKELRATTKVRAFLAIANYNFVMLNARARSAMQAAAEKQMEERPGVPIMMHEVAGLKLKTDEGAEFGPEEMVQSMVDGIQVPLKRILERNPDLSGNAEFGKLNGKDLLGDFARGNLYSFVEALWDDCLWIGYVASQEQRRVTFRLPKPEWQIRAVVSRVRMGSLAREFAVHSMNIQRRPFLQAMVQDVGLADVTSVAKVGSRQVLRLAPIDLASREGGWLLAMRGYASEPYYTELLDESQPKLKGATMNQLLSTWAIVSKSAHLLREEVEAREVKNPDDSNSWLPGFAPVLQRKALEEAVAAACATTFEQTRALVDFLVFRGAADQELWAQPLVAVSKDNVVPMFATTTSPNLHRLVDVWMWQLGVQMDIRGPAFEAYIRGHLQNDLATSPLLSKVSACHGQGVNFTPSGERTEQIDLVMVIGNQVLIGEAKCFLEPTEPRQIARHRDKVLDAAAQVKRKAVAVSSHKAEFKARAKQVGLEVPDEFDVIPLVVLNSAFHVGVPVDDVPIVDEYILGVYFRGEFNELASHSEEEGLNTVRKRVLYTSAEEGVRALRDFLLSPPQMLPLLKGIRRRWLPVHPVNAEDWMGLYFAVDCVPHLDMEEAAKAFQQAEEARLKAGSGHDGLSDLPALT
jgi:DNA-binding PadR family transcriptional regulator